MSGASHIDLTGGGGEETGGAFSENLGMMTKPEPTLYKKIQSENYNAMLSLGGMSRPATAVNGNQLVDDTFTEMARQVLSESNSGSRNSENAKP